jgi:hypothetical protein
MASSCSSGTDSSAAGQRTAADADFWPRQIRRWRCSSGPGGIPAFGAIGVIAGPVALSLALALVEFAEETRPTGITHARYSDRLLGGPLQ